MKTPPALAKAKVGRPKKLHSVNSAQLEMDIEGILKAIGRSTEAQDTVLSMIAAKGQREQWRGMIAVPPGGLADRIIGEFRTKTNIPLEIPFFTLLSLVSGYLLKKNVVLRSNLGEIRPDIWSVILASSGAGKTYTQKSIINGLATIGEVEFNGTGIVSSAAFVQALSINPTGVWVRDEFARYLKSIDSEQGPLAEMKD